MFDVTIGTKSMLTDYGLYLQEKNIGFPVPQTNTVQVTGRHGLIDLTEAFGEVKFNNRSISLIFVTMDRLSYDATFKALLNYIHGQKLTIRFSEDSNYYYIGRITVNSFKSDKRIGTIEIECDCEPFRYKNNVTVRTFNITTSQVVTLTNGRKTVVPLVTASVNMTLTWGTTSVSILAGVPTSIPLLQLVEGNNSITVTGTGTITFEYQEGDL